MRSRAGNGVDVEADIRWKDTSREAREPLEEGTQVNRLALRLRGTDPIEQLSHQTPAPIRRGADLLEKQGALGLGHLPEQIEIAPHHGQQVVEVMCHAAREAPHRLAAPRLREL